MVHYHKFATKCEQYEDYAIAVCELGSQLVAVACAAIKRVWIDGQEELGGYVFDVRVDQNFQGRGLGNGLSIELEQACRRRGVTYM